MKPSIADDPRNPDAGRSLWLLGETLASTGSLERLTRLIARQVRETTDARRVALFARDGSGRLTHADASLPEEGGGGDGGEVVALPLLARADVQGVLVVRQVLTGTAAMLESFAARAALALAAARDAAGGRGDAAAIRARVAAQIVHKVNNRLGAIHIYAYLLAERLRRGGDSGGLEVATKLCTAVDRLASEVGELATPAGTAVVERSPTGLDALVEESIASVAGDLAGRGVQVDRRLGDVGPVSLHGSSLADALREILRDVGSALVAGATVVLETRRLSPQAVEIVLESAVSMAHVSDALFAGESAGLGQALLRDVVERQAATVVVSVAGRGATIRIALGGGAG